MFTGHLWELLIVLVLALVFVGPGKLPEVGGAIGRGIREFRKASSDLERTLTGEPEPPAPAPPLVPPAVEAPAQQAITDAPPTPVAHSAPGSEGTAHKG